MTTVNIAPFIFLLFGTYDYVKVLCQSSVTVLDTLSLPVGCFQCFQVLVVKC